MYTFENGPASIVLLSTTVFLLVLSSRIKDKGDLAVNVKRVLIFAAFNVGAVAGMYAFWAWASLDNATQFRTWAKLVDGLAAFGVAYSMYNIQKALKR